MHIKFWGVRGSIPTPSEKTVLFGGNSSCVSAEIDQNLIVFDAGTGIRNLGNAILAQKSIYPISIFLSHVHWDHIQGFPFFAPAYIKDYKIHVHGRGKADQTLGKILAGQMEGPNFPVSLNDLDANLSYSDLTSGQVIALKNNAGEIFAKMQPSEGNHPNGVLVYRLDDIKKGSAVVYSTDTEHYTEGVDTNIGNLAKGADVLIYDGMYTPEEYATKYKGWGHSTWEKGLELAQYAGVKTLIIFHHDPNHDDDFLTAYEKEVQAKVKILAPQLQIFFAREGMELDI